MGAYCDTNFFVRLLIEGAESATAVRRLQSIRGGRAQAIPVTWLIQVEVANALQQAVFLGRQGVQPHVGPQQADVAQARFDEWLADGVHFTVAPLATSELAQEARRISLRHTARHGFRAYDVIHVASALLLKRDAFWSFDLKATQLANLERLRTR